MNAVTQTDAGTVRAGRGPTPPVTQAPSGNRYLRLAASTLPLPDGDLWSANPTFGQQAPAVVGQIRDSVAFIGNHCRMLPEVRPFAAPFDWLNRVGSYQGAFYRDVLRDGPRRLVETDGPMAAGWRRPTYRPVCEALTRPDSRIGNHLARLAQMGVDAGIGICAVARIVGLLLLLKAERAGILAYIHRDHLLATATALGMAVFTAAVFI